jgi:hypothetical protein
MKVDFLKTMFPTLNGTWGSLEELNVCAKILLEEIIPKENLVDPLRQIGFIKLIHKIKRVDYTFGGWMENREDLWKAHYQKKDHVHHLGVDFNIPENTPFHAPIKSKLVLHAYDTDQDGGWGGKIILETEKGMYYIAGHLKEMAISETYEPGQFMGNIAGPECNGNWFPHLHLQCMRKLDTNVDGYAWKYPGIEEDFPHPFILMP